MGIDRRVRTFELEVDGQLFTARRISHSFREGVEVEVQVGETILRVSDRQLGESEAIRILESQLREKLRFGNSG